MRQKVYMLFYRPKGREVFTTVSHEEVAKYTDRHANISKSIEIMDDVRRIMSEKNPHNEYAVFRCEQTSVCSVQ